MTRAAWTMVAALFCAAMPIAACATLAGSSYAQARTPLERAEAAWARIRIIGALASLVLPRSDASDLRGWMMEADRALAAARLTRDLEQLHDLQKLQRAAAAIADKVPPRCLLATGCP